MFTLANILFLYVSIHMEFSLRIIFFNERKSNNDNILYQGRNTQFYVHILVVCLKNEVIKNWAQQMLSLERVHLIV